MSSYWIVWYGEVQPGDRADVEAHLDRAVSELGRHHACVVAADYEYHRDAATVAFGMTVETAATRAVAVYRASKALRHSLHRAGIGIPYPPMYGPRPALRVRLEHWPHAVRVLQPVARTGGRVASRGSGSWERG